MKKTYIKTILERLRKGKSPNDAWKTMIKYLGEQTDSDIAISSKIRKDLSSTLMRGDGFFIESKFRPKGNKPEYFRIDVISGVIRETLIDRLGDYPDPNLTNQEIYEIIKTVQADFDKLS